MRSVEPAERWRGLEAQLVGELLAERLERADGIDVTTGSVERDHEQLAGLARGAGSRGWPPRAAGSPRGRALGVALGGGDLLDRSDPEIGQSPDVGLGELLVGEVAESGAAPQRRGSLAESTLPALGSTHDRAGPRMPSAHQVARSGGRRWTVPRSTCSRYPGGRRRDRRAGWSSGRTAILQQLGDVDVDRSGRRSWAADRPTAGSTSRSGETSWSACEDQDRPGAERCLGGQRDADVAGLTSTGPSTCTVHRSTKSRDRRAGADGHRNHPTLTDSRPGQCTRPTAFGHRAAVKHTAEQGGSERPAIESIT